MKKIIKFSSFLIFLIIFRNWFLHPFVIASDWPYFFTETLRDFSLFPPAWAPTYGIGLGGESILYALDSYMHLIIWVFVNRLGLPWEIVYKFFIFGAFIYISIISSRYLLKTVLQKVSIFQSFLTALLFTANTHILMLVDGGQVGIALAYSITPFVLARFIKLIKNSSNDWNFKAQCSIIAGIALSLQVMFDVRIAYLTMIVVGFFYLLNIQYELSKKNILVLCSKLFYDLFLPLIITILLHISWILPILLSQSSPTQEIINRQTSVGAFKFFSFATFSQTLSLLHPNWPENIFGKVYFMKPEFLLLPILAFSSLLFIGSSPVRQAQGKTQNVNSNLSISRIILFFILLSLLGAFLAKGANEPFGLLNELIYQHIPGMSMFRDPTKFYLLIALSYSVLIPFSLQQIFTRVLSIRCQVLGKKLTVSYAGYIIPAIFVIFLLFLIRPIFLNQLGGTFQGANIPKEYVDLKNFLYDQRTFSRTLWVPHQQRYNFYSYTHPAVPADLLFKATNSAEIFSRFRKVDTKEYLANISVQYIIVPYDSFGEIFIKDRKYDKEQYEDVVKQLDSISWLEKINEFGMIAVYRTLFAKDHFWINGQGSVSYSMINPTEYRIKIVIQKPTTVIFAESYSPYWVAEIDNKVVKSRKTKEGLNSFLFEKTGQYRIYFVKQKVYEYGRIISALTFFLILIPLWRWRLRKKTVLITGGTGEYNS